MQPARARAELQVGAPFDALWAVPHASAAEHALLAIEIGRPFQASGDRLSGTHLDAQLGPALPAHLEVAEANVVGVPRWRLNFAAHQQHVLMRYQQRTIVSDRGPATGIHQGVMQRSAADVALMLDAGDLRRPELARLPRPPTGIRPPERRPVYFGPAGGILEAQIYDRTALPAGFKEAGPALIEEYGSATLIWPGDSFEIGALGEGLSQLIRGGFRRFRRGGFDGDDQFIGLREMLEKEPDKYTRLLNAVARLSDGQIRCERHRTQEAERHAKIAKDKAGAEKRGITDESLAKAEAKLNLL